MLLKKKEKERRDQKSREGEFLHELENQYELSPKLSSLILLSAKSCLFSRVSLQSGQIEVTVIGIEERAGKSIESMFKQRVVLTLDNGIEDTEILGSYGRVALRRAKIIRLTEEALEQQGVLSQEDLAKYINCTVRTIQRDVKALKKEGQEVVTRGYLHNIGRCQSHKVRIITMYMEGKTFSEIKLLMRHSVGSIKRYLESFTKVIMAQRSGIHNPAAISSVTGLGVNLILQYKSLIKELRRNKETRKNLEELIERSSYRSGIKKRRMNYFPSVGVMTGGSK